MAGAAPQVSPVLAPRLASFRLVVLLTAFSVSVGLRSAVGGAGVAQSSVAGLVFAGCLLLMSGAAGTRVTVSGRALLAGLAGGALVSAPVALSQALSFRPLHDAAGLWTWALVVTVVATAEELFLRGALYDAAQAWAGSVAAELLGAAAFALLHVPLYGWHVLPLDLAVGIVLGGLRAYTGTVTAPAITHVVADVAGWFLR